MKQRRQDYSYGPAENEQILLLSIGSIVGAGFFVGTRSSFAMAGPSLILTFFLIGTVAVIVNLFLIEMSLCGQKSLYFHQYVALALGPKAGMAVACAYILSMLVGQISELLAANMLLEQCVWDLGVPALHGAEHAIRPDRIVTATYLCAAAAAGGEAYLSGARPEQLRPVIGALRQAGADISEEPGGLCIRAGALHAPGPIVTAPYPGFPTDAQAPVMAALLRAEGRTEIRETVFSARFSHVPELRRLGANIELDGQTAHVRGVAALHGTHLRAGDLRGGAAAVIGALGAAGESRVTGLSHLDRGYEDIARDLTALGAAVSRTDAAGHTN